jgi:hypothetical protein
MRPNKRTSAVELAAWYREFAERAGSSVIWDSGLIGRRYPKKKQTFWNRIHVRNNKRGARREAIDL